MHDLIDSRDPQVPQRLLQKLEDRWLVVCLLDELRVTKQYDVVDNGLDCEASLIGAFHRHCVGKHCLAVVVSDNYTLIDPGSSSL